MANTQSMCTSFMSELMLGQHQLGTSTIVSRGSLTAPATDTLKAALYLASATMNASATVYTVTGEVSGTGYVAGGVTVTNATAPTSTNTSATAGVAFFTPSASITYTTVTLSTALTQCCCTTQPRVTRLSVSTRLVHRPSRRGLLL